MPILNEITVGVTHYTKHDNDYFFAKPTEKFQKLPPGIYTLQMSRGGEVYLSPMSAMTDTLIRLPSFTSEKVILEVDKFWSPATKAKFDKRKLVYKRGIILHGLPGVGKSACVSQIMEAEVKAGGIVFFGPPPKMLTHAVKCIREIQGDIRCLVVWEEFDGLIAGDESSYLSLLDGEMQIDNVVYLATTNYLDRIPNRFKKRPSRFAGVIEIPLPDEETRKIYIESKIQADENIDITQWVKATDGFTIDHIKDLIISVMCLDVEFNEAVDRLKDFSYSDEDDFISDRRSERQKLFEGVFNLDDEWK